MCGSAEAGVLNWLALGGAALFVIAIVAIAAVVLARRRRGARAVAPLTPEQHRLRDELRRDVVALATIGERHVFAPESLRAAADFIERSLAPQAVERQSFISTSSGVRVENLIVEIGGASRAHEVVVIGAHYDTVDGTPGADDNASGVAAVIALAKRFANARPERTLRFVAFANEEPPLFKTEEMGSWQFAKRCRDRGETVVAMLSLEMLGYYDTRRGSQRYPLPLAALYPDTGDFLAFAGNLASRSLARRCARAFRRASTMPAETAAVPELVEPIGWSDQWSFWRFGWPAIMVTDTAFFRNPHYHLETDTPETLDYERMARAVDGLIAVIGDLVGWRG